MPRSANLRNGKPFQSLGKCNAKRLHYSANYSVFRRRIGAQAFFNATKEGQQLTNHHVDHGKVLIANLLEPFAFDDYIAFANQVAGYVFAYDYLQ